MAWVAPLTKRAVLRLAFVALSAACGGSAPPALIGQPPDGGGDAVADATSDTGAMMTDAGPDADGGADSSQPDARRDSGPVDTGAPDVQPDAPFVEATHSLPIVTSQGGPVIADPELVTITYADDTNRTVEEQIGAFLVQSSWIATAGAEYGVGNGTHANVELTQSSPTTIDDSGIQAFIASLITAGTAPDPVADAGAGVRSNAIYMIYFPLTTTVSVAGSTLCQYSGGGYHYESSVNANGHSFAYAVVSPCSGGVPATPPENLVWTTSHELIEACTDPFVASAPGYVIFDTTQPWSSMGGEVGDLCTFLLPQWSEGPYTAIQRVYSNAAAMAGGAPCIPTSPEPYYAVDGEPQTWVALPAGQQTTFQLKGWSTAPVSAWALTTYIYPLQGTAMPTASLGAMTMQNGQTTTLLVDMPAGSASGSYTAVLVQSYTGANDYTTSVVGVYVP
jgi:hypothetical protein